VEEEADERAFWVELIIEGSLLKRKRVQPLLDEANELTKIVASSRMTARGKLPGVKRMAANRQPAIENQK
jgi:hypothetical protein